MAWTDLTLWGWFFFLSEWAIRLAMLVVIPFRRTPAAAKGWLLLIFFEPWLGLLLYFLIGRATLPKPSYIEACQGAPPHHGGCLSNPTSDAPPPPSAIRPDELSPPTDPTRSHSRSGCHRIAQANGCGPPPHALGSTGKESRWTA